MKLLKKMILNPGNCFMVVLCAVALFAAGSRVHAIEISRIVLVGSSIDIKISDIVDEGKKDLSKEEIESIGARVTDEYHSRGYTSSYVERLVVKQNGTLEIRIRESKIAGLKISGASGKEEKDIKKMILPQAGEIYNRFLLEERAEAVKKKYNLDTVKLYPVNYRDTGDVFLTVKAEKKSRGNFYGGLSVEPIYGIAPEAGYIYPFEYTAINLFATIGYREGEVKRAEGDVKYFMLPDEKKLCFYVSANVKRQIDIWMSRNIEYKTLSNKPSAGFNYIYGYMLLDVNIGEIISKIHDYRPDEDLITDYDTRLTLDLEFSNIRQKLNSRDVSGIKLEVSGGKNKIAEDGYLISSCRMRGVLSPVSSIRFIARITSYFTTSSERFFWDYVYNVDMLGFPDDYTASKWKNVAAFEAEYEVSPDFIFAGPFVNSGLFQDESKKWDRKAGGGVKAEITYKKVSIDVYFAWDLSKGASEGGLYVLAGGRF